MCAMVLIGVGAAGPTQDTTANINWTEAERERIGEHSPMPAIPDDPTNRVADDPAAAHFGQYLFFETRFSSSGAVSCATCHDPQHGFSNAGQFGEGVGTTMRHVQSLFNVAWNRWYYWDGSADSLWSQALRPMEGVVEMNGSRTAVAHAIADDPPLRRAYEHIFGAMPDLSDAARFPADAKPVPGAGDDPRQRAWDAMAPGDQRTINTIFSNVAKAIAAYERRIITQDSAFDRFVKGLRTGNEDLKRNLSPSAQRGLRLFIGEANCRLCHTGPNFTDGEFHSLGLPNTDGTVPTDPGRYDGAAKLKRDVFRASGPFSDAAEGAAALRVQQVLVSPEHWGQFKTPSLRNVALTAPYMHQGQFATLENVLHFYSTLDAQVQMGHHRETILQPLHLTDAQRDDLIAFLKSLTGRPLDESLLEKPDSPLPEPSD